MSKSKVTLMLLSVAFLITFNLTTLTIASHNLHSYKKSGQYHKSCLQNFQGIWMAQELWLQEKLLSQLSSLGTQFVARSGMEDRLESGIYRGRPHGGVSIAWTENLNHVVRLLTNYKHKRIVGVEMKTEEADLVFISVYMPFHDTRSRENRENCMLETLETISMI
jgi:hypothetical protein